MLRAVLLSIFLLAVTIDADAQGVVIGPHSKPADLILRRHHVEADVHEQVAVVTVEHVFFNPGKDVVEGTFLFPLPRDAQITRFVMEVDGKEMAGELLEAEEARRIYENIVRQSLDPALLEMADYQTFRARVFPIPGGASRKISLRYDATLKKEGNLVSFKYPFRGTLSTRHNMRRTWPSLDSVRSAPESGTVQDTPSNQAFNVEAEGSSIHLQLTASTALKNIYSPSHQVEIERPDDFHASVSLENMLARDGRDFVLYYSLERGDVGATLLSHRPYSDRPGYFMLLLSPQVEIASSRIQQKDVVFVLDTSGSMAGDKIVQAKDALRYCLNRLGERDRFGLISFSSDIDTFRPELSSTSSRRDALFFVDQLEARGGTNINDALLTAIQMLEENDHGMIIFLTDGLPSAGITDEGEIRKNVNAANDQDIRVFSFGVGYDVNTKLLDGVSRESEAFADYISPEENIEERVSTFYEKVRYPVFTDLDFELEGIDAFAFAPRSLPDLYKGGQLILTGRYRQPGEASFTLVGQNHGRQEERSYAFQFVEEDRERDYVARIWATRRVGQLLDDIHLNGENEELVDDVVALAKEFGLVTPYTSYLVQEEEPMALDTGAQNRYDSRPLPYSVSGFTQASGERAVQVSKSLRAMQEVEQAPIMYANGFANIQGRTIQQQADLSWTDIEFREDRDNVIQIKFASDAYFNLLRLYPEAREFAQLGDTVTFKFRNQFIQVGSEGETSLTEVELRTKIG